MKTVAFIFPYRHNPAQIRRQQLQMWPVDRMQKELEGRGMAVMFIVADHALPSTDLKRGAGMPTDKRGWAWGGPAQKHKFNRGLALNVGTNHALERGADVVVMHDIDLWPTVEGIVRYAEHMEELASQDAACAVHLGMYWENCPYRGPAFVGGALAMNRQAWVATRGFPNRMYGWGGEDDVWGRRARAVGLVVQKPRPAALVIHMELGPHASAVEEWANTRKHEDMKEGDALGFACTVTEEERESILLSNWYEKCT